MCRDLPNISVSYLSSVWTTDFAMNISAPAGRQSLNPPPPVREPQKPLQQISMAISSSAARDGGEVVGVKSGDQPRAGLVYLIKFGSTMKVRIRTLRMDGRMARTRLAISIEGKPRWTSSARPSRMMRESTAICESKTSYVGLRLGLSLMSISRGEDAGKGTAIGREDGVT